MAANSCRQGTYPVVVGMHVVLRRADLVKWYKVQWFGQCTSDIVPVCANGSKQPCLRGWHRTDVVWAYPCLREWQQNSPARANGSEQMWFGRHETLNVRCLIEASLEIANKITLMLHLLRENLMILLQNHYLNAYDWSTNPS